MQPSNDIIIFEKIEHKTEFETTDKSFDLVVVASGKDRGYIAGTKIIAEAEGDFKYQDKTYFWTKEVVCIVK